MATFTVSANTTAGLDNRIDGVGGLAGLPPSGAQTATQFAINYPGVGLITFTGTGFGGYSGNRPTTGSITQFVIVDAAAPTETVTWSGFTLSAADLNTAIVTNNDAMLQTALFGGNDTLTGARGEDDLYGFGGDDVIRGNGGGDTLDGGAGTDTAVYSGAYANYAVTNIGGGRIMVADTRSGNPDGTDFLNGIELLQFSDQTVPTATVGSGGGGSSTATTTAWNNIIRTGSPGQLATQVALGQVSLSAAVAQMIATADSTTTVATMAYQFFTGRIPSAGGYDFLVSPSANANSLNSPYYQTFNMENRYINFAVNLGKLGEGRAAFESQYGSLSLSAATKQAYGVIFGGTPTDAKVTALLSGGRDAYFAYYGGDGLTGIGTKAAMVGWLMAEAAKANIGMYSMASDAFLTDLADGAAYNVNLVGTYGQASFNYAG